MEKLAKRLKKLAKKYSLIITSGSDYHGQLVLPDHYISRNACDESVVIALKNIVQQ